MIPPKTHKKLLAVKNFRGLSLDEIRYGTSAVAIATRESFYQILRLDNIARHVREDYMDKDRKLKKAERWL